MGTVSADARFDWSIHRSSWLVSWLIECRHYPFTIQALQKFSKVQPKIDHAVPSPLLPIAARAPACQPGCARAASSRGMPSSRFL